jgi:phage shock protein PspC (stress-responsive transcriptional regulator)
VETGGWRMAGGLSEGYRVDVDVVVVVVVVVVIVDARRGEQHMGR